MNMMNKLQKKTVFLLIALQTMAILIVSSNQLFGQKVERIDFEVIGLKDEIKAKEDIYISFKITNKANRDLLIPNVIYYNNASIKRVTLDIGFEICKAINGNYILDDSCFRLAQPLIPEEGYKLKHYKKGESFYCPSSLPLSCIVEKGNYKIRFTYFPKNKGYPKVRSQWYSFTVIRELL